MCGSADGVEPTQRLISAYYSGSDTSSGLTALLAKPQSNHLSLLCALRGHPVARPEALNMSSTIQTQRTMMENAKLHLQTSPTEPPDPALM